MASELRVNSSTNRSGLGTITYTDSGPIVSGVGTFTNGFTVDGTQTTVKSLKLTGDNYNANWFKTTNKLRFNDNAKATFGTSDDLSIFHNASDSVITHGAGGTGNLKILSGGAQSIECIKAGAVNIAHNGSTKLATSSTGVTITGTAVADAVTITGTAVAGALDISGDIDVDGHTNLDNVSIAGVTTFSGRVDTDSINVSTHNDIRFTTGNWSGEHAGKIQFHDNRLYFQSGSNGWNLRNSSGSTIIDITAAGAISGQPLTLAQNLTLNNVTTIGVGRDLRFSQGGWTGEVAGKIQFHSNNLYFQGGTGGHYFRNPSGVNVLIIDVDGDISTNNAPITFDSDCLFNGGSDAIEISANGDIKLNNGNWSGEKTFKIQAHAQTMYLQAPAFIFRDDSGSNRWAINTSGHFNPATNNTYDIGNSSFNVKDIYAAGNLKFTSGAGIDFSATAGTPSNGGEILDDYEEGNFTPRLGGITNYGSYNVTGQGHYVKIGKVVHVNIAFGNIDLNNSAAGRVMIYNLPFAPFIVAGTDCRGVTSNYMSHKVQHANDGMIHSWYIETTYGSFQGQITKNNTNWTSWDASNFTQSGVYIDFSGTYFTAS